MVDARRMVDEFLGGQRLVEEDIDEEDVASLVIQQIEFCTTIVLNKVEGLTEDQLGLLRTVIHKLQPEANIIETNYGKVDVKDILDTGRFDFDRALLLHRLGAGSGSRRPRRGRRRTRR